MTFVDGLNEGERCMACNKKASEFAKLFKSRLKYEWLLHVSNRKNIH